MDIQWPSAVVALGLFGVLGGIVIGAIVRYDTADEAMTVFAGVWGALGAGVGLVFAYFFTRGPVSEAKEMAKDAKDTADSAMSMAKAIESKNGEHALGQGLNPRDTAVRAPGQRPPRRTSSHTAAR